MVSRGRVITNPQTLIDVSATLRIGAHQSATEYFKGTLDELALYSYALSPAQVAAHYALRLPERIYMPGLVLLAPTGTGQAVWTTPANAVSITDTPTLAFSMPTASGPMHFQMQLDDDPPSVAPPDVTRARQSDRLGVLDRERLGGRSLDRRAGLVRRQRGPLHGSDAAERHDLPPRPGRGAVMGTPAPSTLEDLTTRVAQLEQLVSDHAQRFDTLQTPLWKRLWFKVDGWPYYDLNGERRRRPWHRGR